LRLGECYKPYITHLLVRCNKNIALHKNIIIRSRRPEPTPLTINFAI
jgi:hypothetical protein